MVECQLRISGKTWQSTPQNGCPGAAPLVRQDRVRTEGRILIRPGGPFRFRSRLAVSCSGPADGPKGMALEQLVAYRPAGPLKGTLQFVVFGIPGWDQRIYLYEPGLYQQFQFPVYNGSGQKITGVVSYTPARRITAGIKCSVVRYEHQHTLGTGNDQMEGNRQWESGIQLRFRF